MELLEILNLCDLSPKEQKKATEKGLAAISLVNKREAADVVGYLRIYGIKITKFKEIKVLLETKENVVNRIKTLNDINEIDVYKEDPRRLLSDANDIKMKIEYCRENHIDYKNENGYETFLFNEKMWQEKVSSATRVVNDTPSLEEPFRMPSVPEPVVDISPITTVEEVKTDSLPINEVSQNEYNITFDDEIKEESVDLGNVIDEDIKDIDSKVTSFADIKKELEAELASLDVLRNDNNNDFDDVISFEDFDAEEYEVGRGRAA